jgi:DNA-binding CsgD family transcriptional regulator
MKTDAISIVEAAYDCGADERAWLRGLLERIAPKLDRGFGVALTTYSPNMRPDESLSEAYQMDTRLAEAQLAMFETYPDVFQHVGASMGAHEISTETIGLTREEAETFPPAVKFLHPFGVKDMVGVVSRDPSRHAVMFAAPIPDVTPPTERERTRWGQIAAHIGAGSRLRRALQTPSKDDLSEGADAILSPSGSMVHAQAGGQTRKAHDLLCGAAKAIDRARSKARGNEDEALDLWQGLVAGRWSLVEQFDSDGRRFMVARRNDPQVTDPRALGLRERQVLAYVAMGHPAKLIAYSLGVSPSSVSTARRTGMRKLGLQTTADVVRLFAQAPPSESSQER